LRHCLWKGATRSYYSIYCNRKTVSCSDECIKVKVNKKLHGRKRNALRENQGNDLIKSSTQSTPEDLAKANARAMQGLRRNCRSRRHVTSHCTQDEHESPARRGNFNTAISRRQTRSLTPTQPPTASVYFSAAAAAAAAPDFCRLYCFFTASLPFGDMFISASILVRRVVSSRVIGESWKRSCGIKSCMARQ
jgi:hypothetical protein